MVRRLRIAFWLSILSAPVLLAGADRLSRRAAPPKSGVRVVTVNVGARPEQVAASLRSLEPDIVLMQETGTSCGVAGGLLGLQWVDGSDQCVLSRWALAAQAVAWPGPWQAPQLVATEHPAMGSLAVVNVRLAIPEVVAAVATLGGQWYSEAQRQGQFPALRRLLVGKYPALVCGDFNALPVEVDLGQAMRDLWSGVRYGATFPASLPAARIDQCWASTGLVASASWTQVVPSDHRALVIDVRVAQSSTP